jgi:hypothetical protein
MARIFRDSGVLNQFGSPSLNSNTIANRPAAGQPGRLFVSTDTLVLYRDNGSSWQVVSATGATQNLEQTTTNGNTTTKGIFAGATGALTSGFLLEVLGRTKLTGTNNNIVYIGLPSITPNNATLDVFGYSSFRLFTDAAANIGSIVRNDFLITLNTNITTGDPSASINQLTLVTNNIASLGNATTGLMYVGSGLNKNTIDDNGSANSTITLVQGSGIFALSPLQSISEYSGLGGTNITHYAGMVINGFRSTNGSAIRIVNNYQLLINSSQQFSGSTTVTNRWGIYQAGANDVNYFAGKILLNKTTDDNTGAILQVKGSITVSDIDNYFINLGTEIGLIKKIYNPPFIAFRSDRDIIFATSINGGGLSINDIYDKVFTIKSFTYNVIIGTNPSNDTGRKLQLYGQQEWITPTATGVHTTSGNHLPIWVNGVQYWLALLNPPI